MAERQKCSQCGAPLTADVPGRLCLRCLLEFGLKPNAPDARAGSLEAEEETDPFPGYQILEQIGEGGCGVVYRALQIEPLRREVAIKVIKLGLDTRSVINRFEAERQTLALMDHPNIARVFDAGITGNGRPFFVMELVKGERITGYCDRKKLSVRQRLELFVQVCQAVQHAHQKGIIHRDLKPSNLLVFEQDGQAVPKVIDFGVAKAMTRQRLANQTIYTAFDQFVGTPAYMSPEQAGLTGEDIDSRSDIYSLGVLLYELLTGRPPFEPERLRQAALDEICHIIREEEPPLPSARLTTLTRPELTETAQFRMRPAARLVHELRGDLDWLVMKALEKDRARRYDSATAMAADIQRHLQDEPVAARPPSALYRFQKMARRNKLAFGAALIVAAALVAGLMASTWMYFREKQARERAEVRAYLSDMGLAARMAAMRVGGLEGAVRLLEFWRPHQRDLRGWEWFYLNGLCHHDALTIRADTNKLWSVAWSPDGRYLATGGTEGAVKIWDAVSGQALASLPGHASNVLSVLWSPDGRWLASAGQDATVKVWNWQKRSALTLAGHREAVDCLAWSPDATRLASGSLDGTVRIWDPVSGATLRTFQAGHGVLALSWAQDGKRLLCGGNGSLLKNWDVASGAELWSLPAHYEGDPMTVAWSPDGTQLATGGRDNSVSFRDAATGTNLVSFFDNHNVVLSVAWNPAGTRLASATMGDGRIALRDLRTGGRVVRDFRGHLGLRPLRGLAARRFADCLRQRGWHGESVERQPTGSFHPQTVSARSGARFVVESGRGQIGGGKPPHRPMDLGFEAAGGARGAPPRFHPLDLCRGVESCGYAAGRRRIGRAGDVGPVRPRQTVAGTVSLGRSPRHRLESGFQANGDRGGQPQTQRLGGGHGQVAPKPCPAERSHGRPGLESGWPESGRRRGPPDLPLGRGQFRRKDRPFRSCGWDSLRGLEPGQCAAGLRQRRLQR